jgi:glycosyltransferase involved in cell wall biosynthesis
LAERNDVPVRIAAFRNTIGDSGELTSRSRLGRRVLPNRLFVALMRGLVKRYATHVVAVSRDALDTMFPSGSQTRPRCQVIYNGVHLARFQGPVEAHAVREEFGWPPDSRIVVNVARLSPQKNHRTMLEAIRIVHERDDRVRLLLVGSGRLRDEVSQQIDDLGMWRICALTSDRTDVPRLLLASDVFFFPSLWEGLPGAPLEALAAGLPVVASDIRPIQEIAEYFPGSVFMSPADAAPEHAEKIHAALSSRSDRGGAQARFASTPFVFEKSVSAHAALYGLANGTP